MQKETLHQAGKYIRQGKIHRVWSRVVAGLACVVLIATTYMLILPAITMEQTACCGIEPHTHDASCYERRLVCGLEEQDPHVHSDSCYQKVQTLICGKEENPGHIHDESCIRREQVLTCTKDHKHTDKCYETVETYTCGLTKGEGAHTHGPECYKTESVLVCGQEENAEGHVHTDDCYEAVLICQKEEHEHTLACFSNPEADVETEADWEKTISDVELTGVWSDDVVAIAKSQIGYEESARNYEVSEDGQKKGYTRYGAWYGDPYGDWCGMFVSFCLHYAGVEDFPLDASCQNWIETLSKKPYQSYFAGGTYDPQPGDLIFFNNDDEEGADHVGIVAEKIDAADTNPARIRTIEGNSSDCVQYVTYDADDSTILGYAALPENELAEDTGSSEDGDTSSEENEDILSGTDEPSDEDLLIEQETDEELSEEASLSVFSLPTAESTDATISIHVQITWTGDASYTRPESLTVKLLSNGTETGQTLTLSADNDWSSAFTGNFPKYDENGKEIAYTVQGDSISNYQFIQSDYTDTKSSVDLTTLELWVPVTQLEAGEDYLVVSGQSGKQSLYRAESTMTDGVLSASVTVNEGSVKDQDGNTYTNYILLNTEDETGQSDYLTWKAVSAEDGMNLQSNVYTAWNGETKYLLSQSGKLKVTGNGTDSGAVFTAVGDGTFQPTDSKGASLYLFKKVSLDISSLPASSYTRDYTMVYRYKPEGGASTETPQATTTSVKVTKAWNDKADHSGDSVTVWLMRNGERMEQSVTLNNENNWTATFDNLPIYNAEGTKYVYDVAEEAKDGYQAEYRYDTTTVSGDAVWLPADKFKDGVTYLIVTSATTGDVTGMEAISSSKFAWTSANGAGTIFVSSSDVYSRYITDEEAQKHTAMQWVAGDLGSKEEKNGVGTRHAFSLKNNGVTDKNGKELYAKNTGEGDLVTKDQLSQGSAQWYYGYTSIDDAGKEVKNKNYLSKTPESQWSYVLGSMNHYFLLNDNHTGDGDSRPAQTFYLYRRYEIEEPQLQVTITNSPIKQTSVTVRKEWAGDKSESRPESIAVQLLADGENTDKTLTLTAATDWSGVFENLPVTDASGNQIEYTVSEVSANGYTASYFYSTGDGGYTVVITNTATSSGYVLPETGGPGTTLFTLSGLCLSLSPLMYRYFARRRRERGAGQ